MTANILCMLFSAIAAVLIFVKRRQGGEARWYLVMGAGFAFLAYEFFTQGRNLSGLPGAVGVAIGMLGLLGEAYGVVGKR
ncbi:MAG: hypothetical protein ABFD46_00210 [Armatimonadota bacterium]